MTQLVLPLGHRDAMTRADFIVAPGNQAALAYLDAFPDWTVAAAALHGPAASGKTHLATIWAERAGAHLIAARELTTLPPECLTGGPAVIENIDDGVADEQILFALLERGTPLLLTARTPPGQWRAALPDLASRFRALVAFELGAPDEALLMSLAVKLFADRQITVPEGVVTHLVRQLERSPAALRDFIGRADAAALESRKPVNLQLIRELMADPRNPS
jgi:chromosomal replication initiation ATPase DnaA